MLVRFHDEHPVHVAPADEQPPPVYFPLHVFVYERLPEYVADAALAIDDVQSYEHDSVPLLVLDEFDTDVQLVLHVWVFIEQFDEAASQVELL